MDKRSLGWKFLSKETFGDGKLKIFFHLLHKNDIFVLTIWYFWWIQKFFHCFPRNNINDLNVENKMFVDMLNHFSDNLFFIHYAKRCRLTMSSQIIAPDVFIIISVHIITEISKFKQKKNRAAIQFTWNDLLSMPQHFADA